MTSLVSLSSARLHRLLADIKRARIGIIGDFCVDSYWLVDPDASEASLESGRPTQPVREQRSSLGGAGNVLANVHALGVTQVQAFGVCGPDPLGRELLQLLAQRKVEAAGIVVQPKGWQTAAYLKPVVGREEGQRYDFGLFNELAPATETALIQAFTAALPNLDVLVINQQLKASLYSPRLLAALNAALAAHPRVIAVVDCRSLAENFPSGTRKLNDLEATRLCGNTYGPTDDIPRSEALAAAAALFARWKRPVFVTRGKHGCLAMDASGVHEIPGLHIINPTDSVGAGDSMVAGIAACLAAQATPSEAAAFGNLVAGVTVQKLHQTGTATPEEVFSIGDQPDYVYQPELADDLRAARYVPNTVIEIASELPAHFELRYAIFDHDGTISTLRQGWEQVMEPMMMRAILGPAFSTADRATYDRVLRQVRDFIDKTTGIQTLRQMDGLARMVREAGFVAAAEILDAQGYKRIYNEALMELVRDRTARLERSELGVEDFTLKNAVALLHRLHEAGVKLFLASGTDEADVIQEAAALGYAALFEGRIYGANLDMTHDAKRMVLEKILREIGETKAAHIVTFGDGPVEIRETRKRGGLTVGIASDERQRFGLAVEKRSRLIRAGAHLVVGDYAQLPALLQLLRLPPRPAPALLS